MFFSYSLVYPHLRHPSFFPYAQSGHRHREQGATIAIRQVLGVNWFIWRRLPSKQLGQSNFGFFDSVFTITGGGAPINIGGGAITTGCWTITGCEYISQAFMFLIIVKYSIGLTILINLFISVIKRSAYSCFIWSSFFQ